MRRDKGFSTNDNSQFVLIINHVLIRNGKEAKLRKAMCRFVQIFDGKQYLSDYQDVRMSDMPSLEHYKIYGCTEGRVLSNFLKKDDKENRYGTE